jgi:anti-sigma regulatory factor (Ser/Thr protein kinase)
MKIHLPNSAYIGNIDGFMRTFDASQPDRLEITTHDKWINIHPAVLTLVATLGLKVGPENVFFDEIVASSGHYLERMGLFRLLGKPSPFEITEHEAAGRFVPLTVIKTQADQSAFITNMIPLLHLLPEQVDAIKYVVGELLRNVLEHAQSSVGAVVAAQYYQASNTVRLGICDGGVGVRTALGGVWPTPSDIDALKLALTPGITGTTRREGGTETNAGAGLFFIKSMASVSRDYFLIYSGSGMYKLHLRRPTKKLPRLHADPVRDRHAETNNAPYFQGTWVAVDISLEQTEQFQALLRAIRTTYSEAVKERRKARYKRPQFL